VVRGKKATNIYLDYDVWLAGRKLALDMSVSFSELVEILLEECLMKAGVRKEEVVESGN